MPRLGVVTVTFNGARVVPAFLDCVLRSESVDFVLYVVDNRSTDGTAALVAACTDPRVVLLAQDRNTGIAAGNNTGIRRALADGCTEVLLVNNDVEFGPGVFAGLSADLAATGAAAVCPKIHYHDNPARLWWAGGGYIPWYMYNNYNRGDGELDRGQYDTPGPVECATTCCMLLRGDVFARVGLMDETYFVYFDDTDFCWKMQAAGLAIHYCPQLTLLHKVSSSTGGRQSPFTVFQESRGRIIFLRKNLPALHRWYCYAFFFAHSLSKFALRRDNWALFKQRVAGIRDGFRAPLARASAG